MENTPKRYYFRSQNPKFKTFIQWAQKGLMLLAFLPLMFFFLIAVLGYGLIRPFLNQNSRKTLVWHFDHIDRFLPSTLELKKNEFALIKRETHPSTQTKAIRLEGEGFYLLKPKQRTVWKGTQDEWEHFDPIASS